LAPDTISTFTVTPTIQATGVAAPTVLGAGADVPYKQGDFIYLLAQDGSDTVTYKFEFHIVTSGGQRIDKDVLMQVVAQ
jgi:hypothetical protein